MDPDYALYASSFKCDPRGMPLFVPEQPEVAAAVGLPRELVGPLDDMFKDYGVSYYTAAKMAELGFTVNTLVSMEEEELDDMISKVSRHYHLLFGECYGIKAAVRAEKRRLEDANTAFDVLSLQGPSEEPMQQEKEMMGSGGSATRGVVVAAERPKKQRKMKNRGCNAVHTQPLLHDHEEEINVKDGDQQQLFALISSAPPPPPPPPPPKKERQREHPFIVTEPGEVARSKKNGLDFLFHLYAQCRELLTQFRNLAKERGQYCPPMVTNQVYKYARDAGETHINKPKLRLYIHCYALHCLDEEKSNALRREFKGKPVGLWREACYKPLVDIASRRLWDIDAIFNEHPELCVWYVPSKLRRLCYAERLFVAASSSADGGSGSSTAHDQLLLCCP